jgi:small subunit ribosomal protein S16
MLKIRLQRTGRTNNPSFRVVLTDSKNATKSGKFLDIVGFYDPKSGEKKFDAPKIKEFIAKGAQLSGTIHNFLVDAKVIDGKKKNVLPKKKITKSRKEVKTAK